MKNIIKTLVAGAAIVVALAGCGGGASIPELDVTLGAVDGGWNLPEEVVSTLSDEEAAIFADAMEGFTGVGYEPSAVVATQLVSGMNRAYLCKGTLVTPDGGESWYIVTVYTDLQGVSTIKDIKEFNIGDPILPAEDAETGDIVGGWSIVKPETSELPAEVAEVYEAAMDGLTGVSYTPIALLGSQLENGTNYMVLAYGETVTASPQAGLYLIQLGSEAGGSVNMAITGQVDLLSYV